MPATSRTLTGWVIVAAILTVCLGVAVRRNPGPGLTGWDLAFVAAAVSFVILFVRLLIFKAAEKLRQIAGSDGVSPHPGDTDHW